MSNKIVRSISYFTKKPSGRTVRKVNKLKNELESWDFLVQTIRVCTKDLGFSEAEKAVGDESVTVGLGSVPFELASKNLHDFYKTKNVFFNFGFNEDTSVEEKHVDFLFRLIKEKPEKTFNFTFDFNTPASSAFYPTARYEKNGFSIGLQTTDLAEGCESLEEWLNKMKTVWQEIAQLFDDNSKFLGIDSSIAPFSDGKGSFVNFTKKLCGSFDASVTTDTYTKISKFIKTQNPKPIGLCGLMFPCLEDFELADEYESGNFVVERNLFLSLHSGLGIDTYPVGVDEYPERVLQILRLVQALSNKYKKPLSTRLVSDGKAKIGVKTDFKNQYLKDVVVKKL